MTLTQRYVYGVHAIPWGEEWDAPPEGIAIVHSWNLPEGNQVIILYERYVLENVEEGERP